MASVGFYPRPESTTTFKIMFHHEVSNEDIINVINALSARLGDLKDPEERGEESRAEQDANLLIQKLSEPAQLYIIWGPDGLPIHHDILSSVSEVARLSATFIANFIQQGYYEDDQGQEKRMAELKQPPYYYDANQQRLPLRDLPMLLRAEPHEARMTVEAAYVRYVQENFERFSEGWVPVSFEEFKDSEECRIYMDPELQEEEEEVEA